MNCIRRGILVASALVLHGLPHQACTREGGLDPVGEYTVEASLGAEPTSALLSIVTEGEGLLAHFSIPGQSTWSLSTIRVEDRTVTLADRFGAAEISFALRFETDSTFTGEWGFGADRGTVTGRRGADPELLPEAPPCGDEPGDLPPPSATRPNTPDPDAARLITSDVALFWEVLGAGPPETLAERLHCDICGAARMPCGTSSPRGWLYGSAPEGRPADLGYFMGYRITQAYYSAAGAGEEALREILTVTDDVDFLERSGYDPLARAREID